MWVFGDAAIVIRRRHFSKWSAYEQQLSNIGRGDRMTDKFDIRDVELIVEMPEEMVAYLDQLVKKLKKGGAGQITRDSIIRAIIRAAREDNFNPTGIENKEQLADKILQSVKSELS